ncbi:MAG: hypothetical protein MAG581_02611 [Deltaproteobacteria bacterium]|nr:hypothetical protein [Deltaproteobacteria bacterium]
MYENSSSFLNQQGTLSKHRFFLDRYLLMLYLRPHYSLRSTSLLSVKKDCDRIDN